LSSLRVLSFPALLALWTNKIGENNMNPSKRRTVIAGNWKMNFTPAEATAFINEIKPMVAGKDKCDIIFVTSPSEEEYALAKEAGIELEVYPVVNEAFIFMVNKENPVSDLSQAQIVDIYTDKITNWSEVGGEDKEIIAYQREVNSGSQTGFLDLVMGDTEPADAPTEKRIEGMGGLVEAISGYDNSDQALGYSYYFYVNEMYVRDGVKLISVDGIAPTPETIADGSYPYTTAYYAVLRSDEPADSAARELLDWVLSDDGQAAAKEAGYVPLG